MARGDAPKARRDEVVSAISSYSLLSEAVGPGGHDNIALVLLGAYVEFKVDVNQHLSTAAECGRLDLVHALLSAGAKDTR